MATALYPGEFPDRALCTFINDPSLSKYAQEAEKLLKELPDVFIPQIQYKRPGVKNTCWYVALNEEPDVWLVNFTIVPSELNIELRLARYFSVTDDHINKLGMWYQNHWPTFGLSRIGSEKAISILSGYIEQVTPDVLAGKHKTPSRSSAEYFIRQDLKSLFPEYKVRHGERPIRHPNGSFLELDLHVLDLKFAIEVQGPTHYSNIYGNHEEVVKRDEYKKQWCQEKGIRLMHIEWEGYMKTIYRLPEATRRKQFGLLINHFLSQDTLFTEVTEVTFQNLI